MSKILNQIEMLLSHNAAFATGSVLPKYDQDSYANVCAPSGATCFSYSTEYY